MQKPKYLNDVGSFECIVQAPESGWFGEAGEKLTPYLRIPLMVNDPSNPENNGQITVAKLWLSEQAFDKTIIRLKEVFGFDGDLQALNDGKTTLAGLACNISTEMETYQGKELCKVKWLNPPGGGGAKPMDAVKVSSLLSKLTSRGKALAKTVVGPATSPSPTNTASLPGSRSTAPTTPTPATGSPASEDDDVPF